MGPGGDAEPSASRAANQPVGGLLTAEEIESPGKQFAWGEGQRVPQLYVVREGD